MKKKVATFLIAITFCFAYCIGHFFPIPVHAFSVKGTHLDFLTDKYKSKLQAHSMLKIDSTDVVFVGNSITENFEWGEYFDNPKIKNRGIGSDVIRGVTYRLNTIGSPNKLFLLIGINDLNKNRDLKKVSADYTDLLSKLSSKNKVKEIYVISILPTEGVLTKLNPRIIKANEVLKELAPRFNAKFIDIHSKLVGVDGALKKQYSVDGVHLTETAYTLICKELSNYLI